jgi:hypothetical protein
MAGSISLSLSQQFDELGEPLNGGTLQFYAAGTTTPQSAYQDVALTLPYPNPIVLDSAGRVPAFYLADGQIKIVLKNAGGVTQVSADNLLVVGASSGSGSPPSVDATTIFQTGDLKPRYGTGAHTGWVRANGRTVGSATSGASERANADCEDLFLYLWAEDANLTVSTGRGASAAADWAANKTIALPDWRGRALAFLDDMGNSAAGRLSVTYLGQAATTLGAEGGTESRTLLTANLPPYTPAGTNTGGAASLSFTGPGNISQGGATSVVSNVTTGSTPITFTQPTFTGTAQGGSSTAFGIVSPMKLATIYVKL